MSAICRRRASRQGEFQGRDLARFEFAGQGHADAVLAKFNRASPEINWSLGTEDFGRNTDIQWKPGIAAGRGPCQVGAHLTAALAFWNGVTVLRSPRINFDGRSRASQLVANQQSNMRRP